MLRLQRLHLLADYLAATRNEIAVDEMLLAMARLEPARVGYLPRVPHWVGRAARAPALARTVWRLLWLAWLAGGAVAFFALEYLKFKRLLRGSRTVPAASAALSDGAVLGFSTRVCDVVDPTRFSELPTRWLTCPWAPQHALPKAAVELPLMALVDKADLRDAFRAAVRATYALVRDESRSRWALQSYTALRWFLVRRAVDRISGTLVTAEHFDRWAVLADRSVRAARRQAGAARRLVLVQHGALGCLSGNGHGEGALKPLPVRLACVDELHAYSADAEASFRRAVLVATRRGPPLRVHYFKPAIHLTGGQRAARPRLLFVGHPLCEAFQCAVFRTLRETMAVDAYYKPHPKAPMSRTMSKVGWTIIDNPQVFPRVDLLVSYPSTLVIEYEGAGIRACVHPLDVDGEALPQFLDRTRRMIATAHPASSRTAERND